MRRGFLFLLGVVLAPLAVALLSNAVDLFSFTDGWHSEALTRMVGVAIIGEGALLAFWAAVCFGRAFDPLVRPRSNIEVFDPQQLHAVTGGGLILPLCGILFLLAAVAPFSQAHQDAEHLEVVADLPGHFGDQLVEDTRAHERAGWFFGSLWLLFGVILLATPLLLPPRIWKLGWRIRGWGCGAVVVGIVLSALSALVWLGNGMAMEGASKDLAVASYVGLLAGSADALVGTVVALASRAGRT